MVRRLLAIVVNNRARATGDCMTGVERNRRDWPVRIRDASRPGGAGGGRHMIHLSMVVRGGDPFALLVHADGHSFLFPPALADLAADVAGRAPAELIAVGVGVEITGRLDVPVAELDQRIGRIREATGISAPVEMPGEPDGPPGGR